MLHTVCPAKIDEDNRLIDFSLGSVQRVVYTFRVLCISVFMLG